MRPKRTCTIEECSNPNYAYGLCNKHHQRLLAHGDARYERPTPEQRLLAKVDQNGPIPPHAPDLGNCWIWLGGKDKDGYGRFSVGTGKAREGNRRAHRIAYQLLVGPIPDGMHLDHLCREHACVRPSHLDVVTPELNTFRGVAPSSRNAVKTHCKREHPLEGENVFLNSKGQRQCRICTRTHSAAYRERKAAVH